MSKNHEEEENKSNWTVQQWTDYAREGNDDLEDANLRGADLGCKKLREFPSFGTVLRGVNFRGADLEGADLEGADLQGHDLDNLRMRVAGF